ncbi:MAG: Murein DD-endopeptidase MepM [Syntrophorhabdus sp. PtaB.Bin184]|jgi:murein DD-endopeptidase MepM/ murein hydrolase activator NlpD|nr:MAG: Murein DD-endopeptidase MepM [Syntrophorhabdus sp. PtaB.Bin184]
MKLKRLKKRCMTSVTILVVPHSKSQPLKLRLPVAGLVACMALAVVGAVYITIAGVKTAEYYVMKTKLSYFTREFNALKQSITSLKETNNELSRLVELKSKNNILKSAEFSDSGSINIEAIKKEMMETIESVAEIKKYITEQKNIYLATPRGWPMEGQISSGFGLRHHPVTGVRQHHSGLDIRASRGTPVKVTADGIVTYSGWSGGNGNIIVVEHGHGFSTAYAHNKENLVTVGQKVRKGQHIALSGSTGMSTGPHLHYEVWRNGKPVDPAHYLKDG